MAYDDKPPTGWGPKKWVRELQLNGSHHPAQWFSASGDLSPQGTFQECLEEIFLISKTRRLVGRSQGCG